MTQFRFASRGWLPLIPVAVALLLQWAVILSRNFDGLYGQDAYAYYTYSLRLRDSLVQGHTPPPFFWPVGYPALVTLGIALVGRSPLAAQIVSSLAGSGVVVLVYALARDLLMDDGASAQTARWVGIVAGLLAAGCGQLWLWSIVAMSDTAALFWATLSAWGLVRYGRNQVMIWLLLAACTLATAIITRWMYGLLAAPFGIFWLTLAWNRRRVPHLLIAFLAGLVIVLPQLLLSAANPAPVLGHELLLDWSPLNALRRSFVTNNGTATYSLPVAAFYAKAAASPRYLFPLFTPFLLGGIWLSIQHRRRRVLIMLLGWGAIIFGYLSGIPFQNFRLALSLLPPVTILTAIGLRHLWDRLSPRWRPLLHTYLLVGLLAGIWYSSGVLREFIDQKDADLAVARWAGREIPPGTPLLSFGVTLTLMHYTNLDVHELFLMSDEEVRRIVGQQRPVYVLVPVSSLETQWRGFPLERHFRWLREGPGLESLGNQGGYTLFRVGQAATTGRFG